MNKPIHTNGNAIVYCQGAFNTLNGKTAHGLVRFCRRYQVVAVVDKAYAGHDAGQVLDGEPAGIPVKASIDAALETAAAAGNPASHLVVGIAPDGGRLSTSARQDVMHAIDQGLNVDCGLHDFLTEDEQIAALAQRAVNHHPRYPQAPRKEPAALFLGQNRGGGRTQDRHPGHRLGRGQTHYGLADRPGVRTSGIPGRAGRHRSDRMDAGCPLQHDSGFVDQRFRGR